MLYNSLYNFSQGSVLFASLFLFFYEHTFLSCHLFFLLCQQFHHSIHSSFQKSFTKSLTADAIWVLLEQLNFWPFLITDWSKRIKRLFPISEKLNSINQLYVNEAQLKSSTVLNISWIPFSHILFAIFTFNSFEAWVSWENGSDAHPDFSFESDCFIQLSKYKMLIHPNSFSRKVYGILSHQFIYAYEPSLQLLSANLMITSPSLHKRYCSTHITSFKENL